MRRQVVELIKKERIEKVIRHAVERLDIYKDKYQQFSILESGEYDFVLGNLAFNRLYKMSSSGRVSGKVEFYFYLNKENKKIKIKLSYEDESEKKYCDYNIISFNKNENYMQKAVEEVIKSVEEINKNQDLVELRWKGNKNER